MDPEDVTNPDLDPTPTIDLFDLLTQVFHQRLQALKNASQHVHTLNRISAHYLALALYEALQAGHDLHQLLITLADSGRPQT